MAAVIIVRIHRNLVLYAFLLNWELNLRYVYQLSTTLYRC